MSDVAPEADAGQPGDAAAAGASAPDAARPVASPAPLPPPDPTTTFGLLQALAAALPPVGIDELWIFPARRIGPAQSTVLVASVFGDDADSDRRRVFTVRFTVTRDNRGRPELRQDMAEEGSAPAGRVARVVDGVLRRLLDEPAPPRHARIEGLPVRWQELLLAVRSGEPI